MGFSTSTDGLTDKLTELIYKIWLLNKKKFFFEFEHLEYFEAFFKGVLEVMSFLFHVDVFPVCFFLC